MSQRCTFFYSFKFDESILYSGTTRAGKAGGGIIFEYSLGAQIGGGVLHVVMIYLGTSAHGKVGRQAD